MKSGKLRSVAIGVIAASLCCMGCLSGTAEAQVKYPTKPIELVNTFPPGGPTDIPARIVITELSKELGTQITMQYKPGAGGMIGAAYVSTAKPDGYTLVWSSSSTISAPLLEKEAAAYDPLKDFTTIATAVVIANVLTTNASSALTSMDVMLKVAKEKPGSLTCATPGVGTTPHFVLEVFRMHGINVIAVPTKGGAAAATSALGKHTDMGIHLYSAAIPHVKSGGLRLLATTDKMVQEPNVPMLKEKGFPETSGLGSLMGLMGPAGLPKPIVDQIAAGVRKVTQMPSVKKALEDAGYTIDYRGPEEMAKKHAEDYKIVDALAKSAGLGKYAK